MGGRAPAARSGARRLWNVFSDQRISQAMAARCVLAGSRARARVHAYVSVGRAAQLDDLRSIELDLSGMLHDQ